MLAMYISANQFKVSSDLTTDFTAGRRIKADCGSDGVKYSTIVSSSYSSQYTTVTIDEEVLTANLIDILYGIINVGPEGSFPEHVHDDTEGQGGQISLSDLTNKSFLSLTDRSFLNLTDTPSSFTGANGKYLTISGSSVVFTDQSTGSAWFVDTGEPQQSLGYLDDFYIDTNTNDVYVKTTWIEDSPEPLFTRDLGGDGNAGGTTQGAPIDNTTYYTFDGSDDGVLYTEYTGDENSISLKARVRFHDLSKWAAQNIWKAGGGTSGFALGIDATNNVGVFGRNTSNLTTLTTPASNLEENVWYTIYADKNKVSFLSDGGNLIQISGTAVSADDGTGAETVGYACSSTVITATSSDTEWFDGDIDYVKVYGEYVLDFPVTGSAYWQKLASFEVLTYGSGVPTTSSGVKEENKYVDTLSGDMYVYSSDTWVQFFDFANTVSTVSGSFVNLTDTPSSYDEGKYLRSTVDGTEWVTVSGSSAATTILELTDTPSSYDEGKYLRSTVDGTEWVTVSGSSAATTILELTDTPSSYDEGKYLRSTASGIEFVDVSQYTEATIIADSDLFVLSSAGTDKKLTGATFKAISGTYREVLVSTSGINLTADQCRSSILNNDGQQTENIAYLPDCEEGLSSTVEITSVSGSFHLKPKSSDKIFLDGEELDNGDKVSITSPVSGNSFSFYAVKKGSVYSWKVVSGPNTTVIDGGT